MVSNLSLVFRMLRFPSLTLLCYFSCVQICEGASTGMQLRPISHQGEIGLVEAIPNHNPNQTNEKLGEKCEPDPKAKFFLTDDFKDSVLMNELLDEVGARPFYCSISLIGDLGLDKKDISACDCWIAHSASLSESNCPEPSKRELCACTYTDTDTANIPCLQNENGGKKANSSSKELTTKGGNDVADQLYAVNEQLCNASYLGIVVVACGGNNYLFDCGDGRTLLLTPEDICSLDCFYIHGSTKAPYGVCAKSNSNSNQFGVVCICLF